jgi:hypothetical protein
MSKAPRNQIVGRPLDDDDVPPGHSPDTVPDMGEAHEHEALKEPLDPPKRYKLLSADATIDGQKYSTHFPDHGGHYGIFVFTDKQASAVEAQGWQIVELGGEDDFSVHPELEQEEKDEEASRHKAPPKKVDNKGF